MAAHYVSIPELEMRQHLEAQQFKEVKLEGTTEIVYGKIVKPHTCLRVYTSIAHGTSRKVGEDAIRVCLVYRLPEGTIKGIGSDKRVNRVESWKKNLQLRLDKWELELLGPTCQYCNFPTKLRKGKNGNFYGCIQYPNCKYTENA